MPKNALHTLASNPFTDIENANMTPEGIQDQLLTVAEEIKRDDAMMASELLILSQRSNAAENASPRNSARGNATKRSLKQRNGPGQPTVEIKETYTTGAFIAKKREIGLMRLALTNKEAEKRHLEEEMDRTEKRLRQQQEQLASTEEKFNNFLKHSNLEQDAAVRHAEVETKAKQERLVDIKRLSAQISHVEQEMHKTEVQLEFCMEYKNFMDNLTNPQWFYDVLRSLREKDTNEMILLETEEEYERRAGKLTKAAEAREALRIQLSQTNEKSGASNECVGKALPTDSCTEDEEEEIPLERQLEQLHQDLATEAQQRQEREAERIKQEVEALSVDDVRAVLDKNYPQERIPMFFAEPDQILDIFINVEEGNLFLIQNNQELEEELERVAMEFFQEQDEMATMMRQRHSQMESLMTRIRESQQRLNQLEERLIELERIDGDEGHNGGGGDGGGGNRSRGIAGKSKNSSESVKKQDELKKCIERAVADIFCCIHQRSVNASRPQEEFLLSQEKTLPSGAKKKSATSDTRNSSRKLSTKAKSKRRETGNGPMAMGGNGFDDHGRETGANMGPVEMLTIIENKVDEYHRYISNPENGVEKSLIMAVIKAHEKERRSQARILHLAEQMTELEQRNRRALERSLAPVVKHRGKPIMWRSRPPTKLLMNKEVTQGAVVKEVEQDDEFFR